MRSVPPGDSNKTVGMIKMASTDSPLKTGWLIPMTDGGEDWDLECFAVSHSLSRADGGERLSASASSTRQRRCISQIWSRCRPPQGLPGAS